MTGEDVYFSHSHQVIPFMLMLRNIPNTEVLDIFLGVVSEQIRTHGIGTEGRLNDTQIYAVFG